MAGLFIDSTWHYGNNNIPQKYNENTGINTAISPSNFGLPNPCLLFGATAGLTKILAPQSNLFLGWRTVIDLPGNGKPGGTLYSASVVLTNRAIQQVFEVFALPDGTFGAFANNSLMFQTDPAKFSVSSGVPFFVEIAYVTTGGLGSNISVSGTITINGQVVGSGAADSLVGVSTTIGQNSKVDIHQWGSVAGIGTTYFKDLYIFNDQGGINNSNIGDVSIQAIYPRADDGVSWGTFPAGAPNHFSLINEHPPDDDSSYIYDFNPGDIDEWLFQPISTFVGTVIGVQFLVYARKDQEGGRSITLTKNNSPYPVVFYIADFYRYYIVFDDGPWTVPTFNATSFGVKINT